VIGTGAACGDGVMNVRILAEEVGVGAKAAGGAPNGEPGICRFSNIWIASCWCFNFGKLSRFILVPVSLVTLCCEETFSEWKRAFTARERVGHDKCILTGER